MSARASQRLIAAVFEFASRIDGNVQGPPQTAVRDYWGATATALMLENPPLQARTRDPHHHRPHFGMHLALKTPPETRRHRWRWAYRTKTCTLALLSIGLTTACFDSSSGSSTVIHPTLVGVTPAHFVGDVPCLEAEGAMRRYSATLIDVTADLPEERFELPSSSLVPCQQAVTSSFVIPGHRYIAMVRAYDRTDLQPQRPGSPLAVTSQGHVVEPRWTTVCGKPASTNPDNGGAGAGGAPADSEAGAGGAAGSLGQAAGPTSGVRGVTSASRFTVYTTYCLPLSAHAPASDTIVSVGVTSALYELECGSAAGQVSGFVAELEGSSRPPKRGTCGETVQFEELDPGTNYRFNVLAFETGSTSATWQTTCRAKALNGTVTPASCDPLVQR